MADGIGGIGSSGLSSFDLGGIAPNGGGPGPTGTGALGDAGLSPIGSTGLTAFGLDGPVGGQSEAAKLDHYDSLVQQNWDQLNANAQNNADLSRSIAQTAELSKPPAFTLQPIAPPRFDPPPAFPTFTLPPPATGPAPLPTPPAFAGQPPDAAGFTPPAPTAPTFTLPDAAGGPVPAAPGLADLPAPIPAAPFTPFAMAPDALASPVVKPDIAAPTAAVDPFAPVAAGGLGLSPVGAPAVTAFGQDGPVPAPGAETGLEPVTGGATAFRTAPPILDGGPDAAEARPIVSEQPQTPSPDFSAPPSGDELAFRGNLGWGRTRNGDVVLAWPNFLVEIGRAIAYPGRVLNGDAQVFDPATGQPTDEALLNAWTMAGLVGGGTGSFATREAGEAVFGAGPVRVLRGVGPHGLNVTEGVAVTGARAIDLGQAYEAGVRGLYDSKAFQARRYSAVLETGRVTGVADNVAIIGGKSTAVEAKFVDDWANSLRNPASPSGGRAWAVAEQRAMVDQAKRYANGFEGGAIYHTNSPELAAHYGQIFRDAGIDNIRFVLTPALRPGVL